MNHQDLKKLSYEELVDLNKAVVVETRLRQVQRQQNAARAFSVGDKAKFMDKTGRIVTIVIERINLKTVSGREVSSPTRKWNVSPTLLETAF
jgi:hypothetical protein